jgi:hypothetical protein
MGEPNGKCVVIGLDATAGFGQPPGRAGGY